ncbi:MAG: bifunctional folylpolyglutamate synthase/dihydrofolate synthase [Coriobacteriia bacterium]|nr:bifunctional folylpolyglutamate synthase/dihydrofolate synthase [Coriobacteriia bacterium]
MTFDEALELLEGALSFGIHPSLDGIRALTALLGIPQDSFSSMQVTGTNGKTSVTRIAAALLSAHGHRTGVYTSPHLVSYSERMVIDGEQASEEEFSAALGAVAGVVEADSVRQAQTLGLDATSLDLAYTEFELLTAAALWLFRERSCDWACLEIGMGGRWDATSVVMPKVSVVTGVGLDHTERLGTTRAQIAADKAHIIKPGSVAVFGPGCEGVEDVLLARAVETGSAVVRVGLADEDVAWRVTAAPQQPGDRTWMDVYGVYATYDELAATAPSYQAPNIATAIAAAECALGRALEADTVRATLLSLPFPGRFELLCSEPPVIIDGAHNPQAAAVLASAIREAFGERGPVIVLGILRDKDAAGIIEALAPVARSFVCTQSSSPRSLEPEELARIVEAIVGVRPPVYADLSMALRYAEQIASDDSTGVVVTGSLYTAGEVRSPGVG